VSPYDAPTPFLRVSERTVAAMTSAARRAHPNETGGILLGVHRGVDPWVTHAIEIDTSDRGKRHYRIPRGATQPAVHAARRNDQRLGYLGDWHTHPDDVGPSATDLATLALISLRHPLRPNPTLLVVRRQDPGYALDARRILTVRPEQCEVRLTGDLPPDTPSP
jgi:integrative and conjugative element protein (TIGR02256 family)